MTARLGLVSGLRRFSDFVDASDTKKQVLVELRGTTVVEEWSLYDGSTYVAPLSPTWDGIRLDVVAVRTLEESSLVRVESLAECQATAGTWFYDPDPPELDEVHWDDGERTWDDGETRWDQFRRLYLHLPAGADPGATTVIVEHPFSFALRPQTHPDLGVDKLEDGGLEDWASTTELESWTAELGAGATLERITALCQGDFAAELQGGTEGGLIRQDRATVVGGCYRLSGTYQTPAGADVAPQLAVTDTAGAEHLAADGRTVAGAAQDLELLPTHGELRRFFFDLRAWTTTTRLQLVAPAGCVVRFDQVAFQRIWRWPYHEPRLAASAIPATSTGSNDIYFGGKTIGIGSVTLSDPDGEVARLIASFDWLNHEVRFSYGGAFADGEELPREDYRRGFTGLIQRASAEELGVLLELKDSRVFFNVKLPFESFSDADGSPEKGIVGKPIPLWFGAKENITPPRASRTEYGTYQLADTSLAPNGIKSIDKVWAYLDTTAASERDPTKRLELLEGTDYEVDLVEAKVEVITDVQVIEVTAEESKLDFDDGSAKVATIPPGLYTPRTLCAEISAQMNSVSTDWTATCSDVTHKPAIARSAGTASLLCSSGANKDQSLWTLIGFDKGADRTGAQSYEADEAIYEPDDVDRKHVLRVDGLGFKDDASGTYTGMPEALIETGEAILRVLWARYLKQPASLIDEPSFAFARERAPESLAVYLKNTTTIKEIFDRLEHSNISNIVVNGEGRIFYHVYAGEVPEGITDLYGWDFLSFRSEVAVTDVYTTIQVHYDQDPSTGEWETRSSTDPSTALRHGRPDIRPFETFLKFGDNAQSAADRMRELAKRPARKMTFSAKGKLIDKEVGDKVRVTRSKAMDPAGKLSGLVVRIIGMRKRHSEGIAEADCVDDVVTVATFACVTSCQRFCETSCQIGCERSCEAKCETDCQEGCEVECEVGCEAECEEGCEVACEGACQADCQKVCENACQKTCEVDCQRACQKSCQDACETGCQEGCEVVCEGQCEKVCQTYTEQRTGFF